VPTATSPLEVVDGEVRMLIRRRGLHLFNLFTDSGRVRLLVRGVVVDYSERLLASALPPIGDPDAVGASTCPPAQRSSSRASLRMAGMGSGPEAQLTASGPSRSSCRGRSGVAL